MRLGVLLGLLCAPAWPAVALPLHPADPGEREKIVDAMNRAQTYASAIDLARLERKNAEDNLVDALKIHNAGLADFWRQDIADQDRLIRENTPLRDVLRDKAIHRALTAYGLVPANFGGGPSMPLGVAHMPDALNGRSVQWLVVSQDNVERIGQGAHGQPVLVPAQDEKTRALTGSDGITTVFDLAFSRGPEYLALVLSHEQVHFEQFTSPDRGPQMSYNEREYEAWAKTDENLARLGFSPELKAVVKGEIDRNLAEYKSAADKERLWSRLTLGAKAPAQGNYAIHNDAELSAITARFDDMSQVVEGEIAAAREQAVRQRAESSRSVPPAAPLFNPLWPEGYPAANLAKVARLACQSPDSLTQAEVDRLFPTGKVLGAELSGCSALEGQLMLSGCSLAIYRDFCRDAPTLTTLYVDRLGILADAADYRRTGFTHPERQSPAPTPAPAPGSPTDPSDPPGREPRPPKEPPTRHPHAPKPGPWNG